MAAIPGIKGDRIVSQINALSITEVKDFFDHSEKTTWFIGVDSTLFADDTYVQGYHDFTDLYRDCQQILTPHGVVIFFDHQL